MGESARILIIEDDDDVRRILRIMLEDEGYIVDVARNGKEAINKSNMTFYNIALIDILLPDMKGTQLLKAIKKTMPEMGKIVITGFPSLENAIEAVNSGADSFLLKPFQGEELLKTVRTLLEKQEKAKKYSQEQIAEFIETRVREL